MTPFESVPLRECEGGVKRHHMFTSSTLLFQPNNFLARFNVIKKCANSFDCLVNKMLCIQDLKPALGVQSDSLSAKRFM